MATFIDEGDKPLEDEEEFASFEDAQGEATLNEEPVQDDEDDIPEKYKGKSVKDIVRMASRQGLSSLIRQGDGFGVAEDCPRLCRRVAVGFRRPAGR